MHQPPPKDDSTGSSGGEPLSAEAIFQAAQNMRLGSLSVGDIPEKLTAAGQDVRTRAGNVSKEFYAQATKMEEICSHTRNVQGNSWHSAAGRAYRQKLNDTQGKITDVRDDIRGIGLMTHKGGEEIGQKFDEKSNAIRTKAREIDNSIQEYAKLAANMSGSAEYGLQVLVGGQQEELKKEIYDAEKILKQYYSFSE